MKEGLVKLPDGLWWPASDRECYAPVKESLADLPAVLAYCRGRRTCVQAGGNAGVWPKALAREFERVVTIEPDAVNFQALAANVTEPNVTKINAAVGAKMGSVEFEAVPHNTGAGRVGNGVPVPLIAIDDLDLCDVDLIALDVEGYETYAVEGAWRTITRDWPVLCLELKGLGLRYKVDENTLRFKLFNVGYHEVVHIRRDIVFARL